MLRRDSCVLIRFLRSTRYNPTMSCRLARLSAASLLVAWSATVASAQTAAAPLTLAAALAQAREASPHLQAVRATAEGLGTAVAAFAALDNPSLEVRNENWGATSGAALLTDTFVVVSQPLPFGGRRQATRDVLAAQSAAASQLVAPSQVTLELEVARRYVDALAAREQEEQLAAHESALSELARVIDSRVSAGATAASEGARLRAELLRVRQLRTQARVELMRRTTALAALVGDAFALEPGRLVTPSRIELPSGSTDTLVATLVDHDPVVVEARGRLDVSRRTVAFEQAVGRLHATAVGGYKRTSGISTGVAAVVLSVPVFDTNTAAKTRAASAARVADLAVVEAERTARAEMAGLVESARLLSRAVDEAEPLDSLDVVRTAARARLRESAADVLGVVDAERLWHDTRRERDALRRDAMRAALELRIRLGLEIQP